MIVTKQSAFTGKTHSLDIPVSLDQILAWQAGALIQNVMPDLSADHREFLMTGVTPEEWEEMFGSWSDDDAEIQSEMLE